MNKLRKAMAVCLSVMLSVWMLVPAWGVQSSYAAPDDNSTEIEAPPTETNASEFVDASATDAEDSTDGDADNGDLADADVAPVGEDSIMLADEAGENVDGDGVDTQSVDTKSEGVCSITADGTTAYYLTLKEALAAVQSNQTIEIYKSCTLDDAVTLGGGTAGVTNVTIKNATAAADGEFNNRDSVVTFTGAAEIVLGDATDSTKACTATVSGVKFDGKSTAREGRAFTVQGGSTLTVGTGADDDTTAFYGMNSNNDGAVFLVTGNGSKVTFNSGTVSECYSGAGKNSYWHGGCVALVKTSATFELNGGTINRNGAIGGLLPTQLYVGVTPFLLWPTASFKMTGGSITNNVSDHGGAIAASGGANGKPWTIEITGGNITNNSASGDGGAIYIGDNEEQSTLVIEGDVKITGNSCGRAGSAICIRNGTLTLKNNASHEAPSITGNSVTSPQGQCIDENHSYNGAYYVQSAIGFTWAYANYSNIKIDISGNTVISGNTNYAGESANLLAFPGKDGASNNITVHDLGARANIGINTRYSDKVDSSGEQFAKVPDGGNANYVYRLVNDKEPSLVGTVTAGDSSITWGDSSKGPLTLTLSAAVSEPTWLTVEFKNTASKKVYRQAVLLGDSESAKDSSGAYTRTVIIKDLPLAYHYDISVVSEQSGWRYTSANAVSDGANFTGTYSTDAQDWNNDNARESYSDAAAGLSVGTLSLNNNTNTASDSSGSEIAMRTLTITAASDDSGGVLGRIAQWLSDTASVVNTMTE